MDSLLPLGPLHMRCQRNDLARAKAEVLFERHALRAERAALAAELSSVQEIRRVRPRPPRPENELRWNSALTPLVSPHTPPLPH
jgi:hypothetical protein